MKNNPMKKWGKDTVELKKKYKKYTQYVKSKFKQN